MALPTVAFDFEIPTFCRSILGVPWQLKSAVPGHICSMVHCSCDLLQAFCLLNSCEPTCLSCTLGGDVQSRTKPCIHLSRQLKVTPQVKSSVLAGGQPIEFEFDSLAIIQKTNYTCYVSESAPLKTCYAQNYVIKLI